MPICIQCPSTTRENSHRSEGTRTFSRQYALAAFESFQSHAVPEVDRRRLLNLELDGRPVENVGYSVAVANSRAYGGGMFVAPDADLADGQFDVVFSEYRGKLHVLRTLPKLFKGTHVENEEVTVMRAAEVKVSADRPFAVYADGEQLTDLPPLPDCRIVVCKPPFAISTPELFSRIHVDRIRLRPDTDGLVDALSNRNLAKAARRMYNVFEDTELKFWDVFLALATTGILAAIIGYFFPFVGLLIVVFLAPAVVNSWGGYAAQTSVGDRGAPRDQPMTALRPY
jgi:hypothetical protein